MKTEFVKVTIVKGVEGISIYFNDYRIFGNKPWGGGTIIKEGNIEIKKILEDIGRAITQ